MDNEKTFEEQVDEALDNKGKQNSQARFRVKEDIKVCDTPALLVEIGCEQLPMLYSKNHLYDALKPKNKRSHTHGLTEQQIKKMPLLIAEPILIYDSLTRRDSIVILTSERDNDNLPIIASVCLNGKGTYQLKQVDSNFVTSFYGRENFNKHFQSVIENNKLLCYDKIKSQALFSVLGLQSPSGLNNLGSIIIIKHSDNIVKNNSVENLTKTITNFVDNDENDPNNPKKPSGGGGGGNVMERPSSSSEVNNESDVSPNKGEPVTEPLDSPKEDNLSNGSNESGDTTITNNAQTPTTRMLTQLLPSREQDAHDQEQQATILNSAENTYSGKENKTMGNLEIYRNDNRSLRQLLDDYEQSEKEVKENSLDEISTEEDYKQLPEADQQTLTEYNTNRKLLVEAKMALDFVATSTIFTPNGNEPCVQMLMDSKTEYAHAVATLTGGFDKRMGKILETVDNHKSFNRSYANAPLTDKTIAGIIKDEMKGGILEKTTVGDLTEVISVTRKIRDTLRIKDDRIVDDTEEVLIHDKGRLNAFEFIDNDEQEREKYEFVEVVESIDGEVLNATGNEKGISEKVDGKNNEVVHNEAPRATTTDPSRVRGNVKLEEVNDKGTEDKHAAASRKNDDRDDR